MTVPVPTTTPPRDGARRQHRHTKSGPAIASTDSSLKRQLHHNATHHLQSPPPRGSVAEPKMPKTPNTDGASKNKKRRPRKPKDKNSPDRLNATASDSATSRPSPVPSPTRQTTPTKVATTPGKAYAGPTFHHSPAPSSLPVPKFFSKSVPSRRTAGLQAMMEEDDSATTDESQASSPALDNPLELLFKAHREEKARFSRQSTDSSDSDSTPDLFGRDIFGMDPESPIRTVSNTPRSSIARPGVERYATDPMFSMDSLNASLPSSPVQSTPRHRDDAERLAKSAALRQLLFQQPGVCPFQPQAQSPYQMPSPSPSPSPAGRSQFTVSPQGSPVHQRYQARPMINSSRPPKAPQFRMPPSNSNPRAPLQNPANVSRGQFDKIFENKSAGLPCTTESRDFSDMENSLRRILKLDPPNMTGGVMI
jgi:hypothetical protein